MFNGGKCQRPQQGCARAGSAVCGARGSCDAQGALASPLPGAQVHDQEPVVFVGVDVVEEVEGRGAVLEVEESAFLLLCHVEPHLGTSQQLREMQVKPMELPAQLWLPSPAQLGSVHAHPHGLVGLEAVHVVGSPKTPGGEELEEVDFHWGLHKHNVVWGQPKAVGKGRAAHQAHQFGQKPWSCSS